MTLHSASKTLIANPAATTCWRITLCLLAMAVTYLALTPNPPPSMDTGWDKANHLLAFAALAAAACFGFPGSRLRALVIAAALLAFGGLIEILQMTLFQRMGEWADLLADLGGIAMGTLVATALLRLLVDRGARQRM